MKIENFIVALCVSFFIALPITFATPSNSLYNLKTSWVTEEGKRIQLESFRGSLLVLTMAYTRCKSACPMTVERLRTVERLLGEKAAEVTFIIVSLDPKSDTTKELKHFKNAHLIDKKNWHLLRGADEDVRALSVATGYSYKEDAETKEILHSNKIMLFSEDGELVDSVEGLNAELTPLVDRILKR